MKKIQMLFIIAMLLPKAVAAQKIQAVFDRSNSTLTFYYDDSSHSGSVYTDTRNSENYPEWTAVSDITQHVNFDQSMKRARLTDCSNWFAGFSKLLDFTNMVYLNTSSVTDMSNMFNGCMALRELNLYFLDTGSVTNMGGMFCNCSNLTALGIHELNTENVTNMSYMFQSCERMTSIYVSNFNTQNVTTMRNMFAGCFALQTLDLRSFSTARLRNTNGMFARCENLVRIYCNTYFNRDYTIDSDRMFTGCTSLVGGNGTTYDTNNVDGSFAQPDQPGGRGYFTDATLPTVGGYVVSGGELYMPSIVKGTVTFTPDDGYDITKGTFTLDNATIVSSKGDGIYSEAGVHITLVGQNAITVTGSGCNGITALGDDSSIDGTGSLTVNSKDGYGISIEYALEVYDRSGSPTLDVYGKDGAIDGHRHWNNRLSAYDYGYLVPYDADITLRSDGTNAVVHELGGLELEKDAFIYDYYYREEYLSVIDLMTMKPVTHEVRMVPKDKIVDYNISLGGTGHEVNNYNCDNFCPESLTSGKVSYIPSTHTLTLNNAQFNYPYWSNEDYYALYVCADEFTLNLIGDNDLVGTDSEYGYGIWFEQYSHNATNWNIRSSGGGSLRINDHIYMTNDNPDSKLKIENVSIVSEDNAHLWSEDDVNVKIINSNIDFWDRSYGQTERFAWYIIGCLRNLTLEDCDFEDGCYWDSDEGVVKNRQGKDETYHVRITGNPSSTDSNDVNGDGTIDIADMATIIKAMIDKEYANYSKLDINGDHVVDAADIAALINSLADKKPNSTASKRKVLHALNHISF